MKKLTRDELNKILENHKHWLNKDVDGWENMKAILCESDLRGVNLYRVDLRGVNLYRVDLRGVNLYRADLRRADLRRADLRGADLRGADLRGVNLYEADLRGADLRGVNLYGANLYKANLLGAKNVPFIPYACPEVGEFIGFKKAHGFIVVLKILKESRRLSATTRKCRCDKAFVMEIQNLDGTKADVEEVSSDYDDYFVYKAGEVASVYKFDEDRWNECSTGIHFFINRQEAVDY